MNTNIFYTTIFYRTIVLIIWSLRKLYHTSRQEKASHQNITEISLDQGIIGEAISTGKWKLVYDLTTTENHGSVGHCTWQSALIVLIRSDGEVIGILESKHT